MDLRRFMVILGRIKGEIKKFLGQDKRLNRKVKPKKFFILETPAALWQSEQPNGQKIKVLVSRQAHVLHSKYQFKYK